MRKYRREIRAQIAEGEGDGCQPYTAGRDFRYIIAKREPYIQCPRKKKLTNFSVFAVSPETSICYIISKCI